MGTEKFLDLCKSEVDLYILGHMDITDNPVDWDTFVVWNCKTLQNNKALLSTTLPDGMYYECTYNGDKHELYIDAYKKFENICVKVED